MHMKCKMQIIAENHHNNKKFFLIYAYNMKTITNFVRKQTTVLNNQPYEKSQA